MMSAWEWKRIGEADARAVLLLLNAVEDADGSLYRTTRAEVDSYFHDTHVWRAQGAWHKGELIAFGLARAVKGVEEARTVTISGGVHAQWRSQGLGFELLERQVKSARKVAKKARIDKPRAAMYIDGPQRSLADLAADFGFVPESRFVEMRRDLSAFDRPSRMSPYIEIVTMTDQLAKEVRRVHNEILSETGPWTHQTKGAWKARLDDLQRDWCMVAIDRFGDRPRLAGYILCSKFSTGHGDPDEGYVEEIVVLPAWRGRHVAHGLLANAIERFRLAGMNYIGVDVSLEAGEDTENSLVTVFEREGFTRRSETSIVEMELA